MKFQVMNRFTRTAAFEADINTTEDAATSVKLGLAARWAHETGANLRGANLVDANLWGANLEGANLRGANLRGANLRGANLVDANLWGANLEGANLRGANLRGANLRGANLVDANLWGANLWGAHLWGANLWGAHLEGAKYGAGVPVTRPPVQLLGLHWPVFIFDDHIKIGCQIHTTAAWAIFNDEQITAMDLLHMLPFWQQWRGTILAAAAAHQVQS